MTSSRAIGVEMAHCLTFPLAMAPDVALTAPRLENLLLQRFQITLATGDQAALLLVLPPQALLQSWSLLGDEAPDFEARKAVLQALLIQTILGQKGAGSYPAGLRMNHVVGLVAVVAIWVLQENLPPSLKKATGGGAVLPATALLVSVT